ncbi:MAG TPA: toll/interleukin-1 receptor domain-containing protein [Blastocatellia bacterium]|nr:toll/interleukin-1 receptor domain-containing protein [Blastocatellia bacterium]
MGYLPGYQHDIFISYAHVDDAAVDEAAGWVTRFREHLDVQLSKRVGRMGAVKIWQDPALEGSQLFDKTIEDAINGSALFIALTSSGYLASAYCKQEVCWFHRKAGSEPLGLAVGDRLRFFNVLVNNVPFGEWPAEFGRTSGFPFHDAESPDDFGYPSDPREKPFQMQMRKLVEGVYRTLCAMKESLQSAEPPVAAAPTPAAPQPSSPLVTPASSDGFTVFLADTADSLRTLRKRVTTELQGKGITVIADVPPPFEAAAHEQQALAAIGKAHMTVHLLDAYPGREIEGDEDKSYAQRQVEFGIEHARSQFIWVPKSLDHAALEEGGYKEFLDRLENGDRTGAGYKFLRGLPAELPHELMDEIEAARRRPAADAEPRAALVDTHFKDQLHALDLIRYLSDKNVQPFINPEEDDPRKNIRILEERLKQVTKLIIVFGSVTSEWVRARLGAAVEIAITEGCPLKACAVYYAGARRKATDGDFRLGLFPVYTFDAEDLNNPQALTPLLDAL